MNPSQQTTPTKAEHVQLVEGLRNLESSDKYKALAPERKKAVQEHVFDKFVAPAMKARRANVDLAGAKTSWVNSRLGIAQGETKPSTAELATSAGLSMAKGGIRTERMLVNVTDSMAKFFASMTPNPSDIKKDFASTKTFKTFEKYIYRSKAELDYRENILNNALGMDINKNIQTKIAEAPGLVAGGAVQQLPFLTVLRGTSWLGGVLKGEALTETLLDGSSKGKYVYNALKGAADGYLSARLEAKTHEEAKGQAKGFAAFEGVGGPIFAYLGRILGIGGPKALKQSVDAVVASNKELVEKANSEKLSGALTKATAASLNEVAQKLGFKDFWDAQSKGQSQKVVDGLMQTAHQANQEIAIHNPDLVKMHAELQLNELTKNPLGAKVLQIAKANGSKLAEDMTSHVIAATKAINGEFEHSSVGAAASKSLEFSDNLTKRIKTNIVFENRSHKFLAALKLLFDEAETKGGKMTKSDNELFNAIQNQLDQDPAYRNLTLKDRLEAGANVHSHIDDILAKGEPDAKGIKRFWRSTEVRPGEPIGTHQRSLLARTNQIEDAPFKTGDHVRIGQTTMLGKIVEADVKHSVVELPSGTKYTVRNSEIFPAGAKKTEIAEEYARRREAATKVQAMREAEEKLAKRSAKKAELEAKKKEIEAKKLEAEQNRKLKEATEKVSGKDKMKLEDAIEQLYPGKTYPELTPEQRQKATDLALGKDK